MSTDRECDRHCDQADVPLPETLAERDQTTGRFLPGNSAALKTGIRARQPRPELVAVAAEVEAGLVNDQGGRGEVSVARGILIRLVGRDYALLESLDAQLAALDGPISPKGRLRSIFAARQALDDRLTKKLQLLGLDRRTKAVTLDEYLARRARDQAVADDA